MTSQKWTKKIVDNKEERQLLTGMITSDKFLQHVLSIYKPELIQVPYIRTVASWVRTYFEQYQTAPKADIQDIFETRVRNGMDPDQVDLIRDFLTDLSDKYESGSSLNIEYLLDQIETYFKGRALKLLTEDIRTALADGNVLEAEAALADYNSVARPTIAGVDVTDKNAIRQAIDYEMGERLFRLPGELGNIVGHFERGWLIGIAGQYKVGKTWWLLEIAYRAILSKLNTVFVSLEMSEREIMRRFWQMATKTVRPGPDAPKTFQMPYYSEREGLIYKPEPARILDSEEAIIKGKSLKRVARGKKLKILEGQAKTTTLGDLKNHLAIWEDQEGFIPDVICLDYADLLAGEDRRLQYRHRLDEIWGGLKGEAERRKCLIVTASQQNDQGQVAEDKRKLGHVNVMMSLNQTDDQKRKGITVIHITAHRDKEYTVGKKAYVYGNLTIGRPYIGSFLREN